MLAASLGMEGGREGRKFFFFLSCVVKCLNFFSLEKKRTQAWNIKGMNC